MRDNLIAFAGVAVTLLVLDFAWLSLMLGPIYQRLLGPILSESVNYPAAAAFYLIYAVGIVFFAVRPALESGDWRDALLRGAALGLLAYATYDLTNLATLKTWSLRVSLLDMGWGAVLTAAAASAGAILSLRLEP
jgi:uncharacterized membrane protein